MDWPGPLNRSATSLDAKGYAQPPIGSLSPSIWFDEDAGGIALGQVGAVG